MTSETVAFPHVAGGLSWAEAVLAGDVVACKWIRLAAERQIKDLERAFRNDPDFPFWFDADEGERICRFMERLPHVKGEWAAKRDRIRLEPWQQFVLSTVFGWKRRADGCRRFRTVYEEVARKNAKSTKMAGVGLYVLAMDGEAGAEVYCTATKKDQAKIVFNDARHMALRSPRWREKFGVEVFTNTVIQPASASWFRALDAEGKTLDGLNVHCAINDELHAQRKRTLYDVIDTATGARRQPLIWNITTAGSDKRGVCYEQRVYLTKVLQRVFVDETYFGVIFTIDDDDDWTDEKVWAKANPNLGVSVYLDEMRAQAAKAKASPASQAAFITKRLNRWVNADSAWVDQRHWNACAQPGLKLEDFAGAECIVCGDLATADDVASIGYIFERDNKHWLIVRHYLPEVKVNEEGKDHYRTWADLGLITVTPGARTDLDLIEADIIETSKWLRIKEAAFDPHQAAQMIAHLMAANITCVEVRQNVDNLSNPMQQLGVRVKNGEIVHAGCPVLDWMVSNTVCHRDQKDRVYPRKEHPDSKIDGVVALLIGLARIFNEPAPPPSVYETRGVFSIQ